MTATYVCERCGGTFDKVVPEADVVAEMQALWGDIPPEDQATVCDTCFNDFMEWWKSREHRE